MAISQEKVFIISAPSGAGKTTLVKKLMEFYPRLMFSVSATTRGPRNNERDGVHYYFLAEDTFREKIKNQEFLEYEEVYPGRFYGTLRSEVDRILEMGNFPIFDVDVVGGLNIKQQFGEKALSIFIQPPSLEVLKERLVNRGSDSEEEIEKRFNKAAEEITYAPRFDQVIVNDVLEKAIEELVQTFGKHMN